MKRRGLLFGIAALGLAGCRYPRDVNGTLERVHRGTLRVGVMEPLVLFRRREEARALAFVAQTLEARMELQEGPAHALLDELKAGRLDLIAGDLPANSPLTKEMAISQPWGRTAYAQEEADAVFGVRKGESAFLLAIGEAITEWRR